MKKLPNNVKSKIVKFTREKHGNLKVASELLGVSITTLKTARRGLEISTPIYDKIIEKFENLK